MIIAFITLSTSFWLGSMFQWTFHIETSVIYVCENTRLRSKGRFFELEMKIGLWGCKKYFYFFSIPNARFIFWVCYQIFLFKTSWRIYPRKRFSLRGCTTRGSVNQVYYKHVKRLKSAVWRKRSDKWSSVHQDNAWARSLEEISDADMWFLTMETEKYPFWPSFGS